jgi:threonine synthase
MDILISSNLERLLFLLGGSEMTADCMAQLNENGKYTAPASVMEKLREVFAGFYCTEEETASVSRSAFADRKYLCDTHTAVGLGAAEKYRSETGDDRPIILASTASPYKFPADVLKSLGKESTTEEPAALLNARHEVSGTAIPEPLAQTLTLPVRFTKTVDPADMASVIFE